LAQVALDKANLEELKKKAKQYRDNLDNAATATYATEEERDAEIELWFDLWQDATFQLFGAQAVDADNARIEAENKAAADAEAAAATAADARAAAGDSARLDAIAADLAEWNAEMTSRKIAADAVLATLDEEYYYVWDPENELYDEFFEYEGAALDDMEALEESYGALKAL
jgi:hypothetical protein